MEGSRVEGGAELAAVLKGLPKALARNALASTARAGAVRLQSAAYAQLALAMASRTPREDDVMIKQSRGRKGDALQSEWLVGPPRRKPWLRWLHDGTKPHEIAAHTGELYSPRLGKFLGRSIQHPGQVPRPWLFAAWHSSNQEVYRAMAEQLRKAVPKQVKRLVSAKYRNTQLKRIFS